MSAVCTQEIQSVRERFWSVAQSAGPSGGESSLVGYVAVVKHLLSVLDALDRQKNATPLVDLLQPTDSDDDACYSSPEQLRTDDADERSLVFSVAILLFERLTGHHPFGAPDYPERRRARLTRGELGTGIKHFLALPAGLRNLLSRALRPAADERFASLAELRQRLEQFVADEGEAPPLPGTPVDLDKTRVIPNAAYFGRTLMAVAADLDDPIAPPPRARNATVRSQGANRLATATEVLLNTVGRLRSLAQRSLLPATWVILGAVLATGVFLMARWSSSSDEQTIASSPRPVSADYAAPPREQETTKLHSLATPALLSQSSRETPRPVLTPRPGLAMGPPGSQESAPTPLSSTIPSSKPNPTPNEKSPQTPTFDPVRGGELIATRSASCIEPKRRARGAGFGLGVLFTRNDGAQRFYFSKTKDVTQAERTCIRAKLRGVVAGAPPRVGHIVNYRIRIGASSANATVMR